MVDGDMAKVVQISIDGDMAKVVQISTDGDMAKVVQISICLINENCLNI